MFKKRTKTNLTYPFLLGVLGSAFAIPIHQTIKNRKKIIDLKEEQPLIGNNSSSGYGK